MFNNLNKKIENKKSFSKCYGPEHSKGLTLIELMVVISIFLVITSTVIFNYGSFKSNVSLQNLTDDIALAIRKAQSFAIGSRGINNVFSNSYGVHFSKNTDRVNLVANNKSFLMFSANTPTSGYIVGSGSCGDPENKCIELFNIASNDTVKDILIDGSSISYTSYLDIIFTRPNPRATFCLRSSIGGSCSTQNISSVSIIISNGQAGIDEKTKTISVQNTGQISTE